MKKTTINANMKKPSFRLVGCGYFPDYQLGGIPLKEKNILYLISVGTKKFENKWVERLINFAKEIKPKKVIIVVADSLQRFNIEIEENLSEIDAFEESKNRGKKWIEDYKSKFSALGKEQEDYEFITWEKLKENEEYQKYFNEITLWNESNNFKQLLLDSVKAYISRFDRKKNESRAIEQSNKFLNEECAVIRVLAKEPNTIGIFYPGAPLEIFNYIIDYANKSRQLDPFFYTELHPTKIKNNRNLKDKLNLTEPSLFFKGRRLSSNFDGSKNECCLSSLKSGF
ncbi:MAG: hypothetical protein E6K54_02970 [Gammaproteobacteria bacterium]|nr:MAG: hypothetical protein E6K54_02970 [Gammaproteobacteria bacterium]